MIWLMRLFNSQFLFQDANSLRLDLASEPVVVLNFGLHVLHFSLTLTQLPEYHTESNRRRKGNMLCYILCQKVCWKATNVPFCTKLFTQAITWLLFQYIGKKFTTFLVILTLFAPGYFRSHYKPTSLRKSLICIPKKIVFLPTNRHNRLLRIVFQAIEDALQFEGA